MYLRIYTFVVIFIVAFFHAASLQAERLEANYGYLFQKYNEGDIDEVIAAANFALGRNKSLTSINKFYFKTYCLLAKAQYDNADFDKAKVTEQAFVNQLGTIFPVTERFDIYHALAEYFIYVGKYNEALVYNAKAADKSNSELENNLLKLQLATIKAKTGFLTMALELILPLENYFSTLITTKTSNSDFKLSNIRKNDLAFKSAIYAELLILKSEIYLNQGDDENAISSFEQSKLRIKETNGIKSNYYAKICFLEGQLFETENKIDEAIKSYSEAFSSSGNYDKNPVKLKILFNNIACHIYQKELVQTESLIRKLQILANSHSGSTEPFQPYYDLAISLRKCYFEDGTLGIKLLDEFLTKHKILPSNHPVRMLAITLGIKWSQEQLMPSKAIGYVNEILSSQGSNLAANAPYLSKYKAVKGILLLKYVGVSDSLKMIVENDIPNQVRELHPAGKEAATLQMFLANYFFKTGQLDSAILHSKLASNIHPNEIGLRVFNNLKQAYFFILKGKITDANAILLSYELEQDKLSKDDPEKLRSALLLREIYGMIGQYAKEDNLKSEMISFSRAKSIHSNLELEVENNIALGAVYLQSGNYLKAQRQFQNAELIVMSKVPKSPLALDLFQFKATLDIIRGNYPAADKLITATLDISKNGFGEKSLTYAAAKLVAADYFESIADYKKSLEAVNAAMEIHETVLGKANFNNIPLLLLKAKIKIRSSKFDPAQVKEIYDNALDLAKSSLGEENPIFINVIIRKADFLIVTENYAEAKNLIARASNYYKKVKGDSPITAELAFMSGKLNYGLKDYKNALKEFKTSSDLYKSIFSINHPMYNKSRGHEARTYFMLKEYNNSLEAMEEIIPRYLKIVDKLFPSMSFGQKGNYWNSIKDEFEFFNFLICSQFIKEKPAEISKVFNNVIATKAILLLSDAKVRQRIFSNSDTLLIRFYNEWVEKKEVLSIAYSLSKAQLVDQRIDIPVLEEQIERLEKEMNGRSQVFETESTKKKVDWQKIRDVLTDDETVIEMVHFRYFSHRFLDSALYAALIVNKQTKANPICVIIPNATHLEKRYFKYYRNAVIKKLNDNLTYKNFWQPIDNQITGTKTIYFSPDGVYSQMNPETFTTPDNKCLFDKYKFRFISNSKDILNQEPPSKRLSFKKEAQNESYLLFGNPEFYSPNNLSSSKSVPPLPGAEAEINEISAILKTSKTLKTLIGSFVTEDTILQVNSPKVLHIATHGYFKENTPEDDNNFMANPMLNSGLMLKGSGDIFDGGVNVNSQKGILTAMEAATLKLDNTELVILSACETGRGEVVNGEGVFGLQRSLFIAGSKAVIMTLFKVNDEVTQKFMKYFYESWLINADKNKSFLYAKSKVKEQYPEAIFWGAFVLIESMPKSIN